MERKMNNSSNWVPLLFGQITTLSRDKHNGLVSSINYKCIELEHLHGNYPKLLGYTFSNLQKSVKNKFREGEVLFGKLRPYLKKILYTPFDGVCSSEIWVLKHTKLALSKYIYYLVQTDQFMMNVNNSSGTRMPRADWDYIKNAQFLMPNIHTQKEIIKVLETWDSCLEKIDKKINLLVSNKKALLTKLFNFEVGKFNSYTNEVYFGDIGEFYKGKSLSKKHINTKGKFECILYGELFTKYPEYVNQILSRTNEEIGFKTVIGDILMPASDVTPKGLATATCILKENVLIGGDINIIRTNSRINPIFISYLLNFQKEKIIQKVSGTTIRHIYINDLKKIKLSIPSKQLQDYIAKVLMNFDEEIGLYRKKRDLIYQQRNYLLNKLISGEMRLPEFKEHNE